MEVFESLVVYLGLFAAVYVLLVAEERVRSIGGRLALLAGAVLLPSLLSGLRAVTVGSDTPMYLDCIRKWIESGIWSVESERFEIGFKWTVRALAFVSDSPSVVFTGLYALTFGIALIAFDRLRTLAPLRLTYVIYLLVCLIPSWNALRQYMACSCALLGFSCLLTGGPVRCVLAMAASVLFHKPTIVCMAVLPLACISTLSARTYLVLVAAASLFGLSVIIAMAPEYWWYVQTYTGETRHAFFKHLLTCGALALAVLSLVSPHMVSVFRWRRPLSRFLGQVVLFALALQLFHFSFDWADRFLMSFAPLIAFICAYLFKYGSLGSKIVSFAYVVPYSFVYHYIVCNQNECNVFAFAF